MVSLINKKTKTENSLYYFLIPILFLVPFFISYLFTIDNISRNTPVSEEEEARYVDNDFIYDLYNQDKKEDVIILGYHQIRDYKYTDGPKTKLFITSPKIFEDEMRYLIENNYNLISLDYYLNHLEDKADYPLKKNSVIITFDDGYSSQYLEAFPILKKYNIPATFFIYTDCIDKYPACMTSQNLKDLSSFGMNIANHTLHHVYLNSYKNETIKKEILENEKALNKILFPKTSSRYLAYPFGGSDDRVRSILKELDYKAGLGIVNNNSSSIDKYNLKRYLLGNDFNIFKKILEK